MRSAAESDGSAMYEVGFNELRVVDEDEAPIRVEAPATYLRVVVELSADASDRSEACEAGESPGAFPMRDDDGRIAEERGFIWASGAAPQPLVAAGGEPRTPRRSRSSPEAAKPRTPRRSRSSPEATKPRGEAAPAAKPPVVARVGPDVR